MMFCEGLPMPDQWMNNYHWSYCTVVVFQGLLMLHFGCLPEPV